MNKKTLTPERRGMLLALIYAWTLALVASTALPLTHSLMFLQELGGFAPFFAALIVGIAAALLAVIAARRLFGMNAPTGNFWAAFSRSSAALLGILGYGLPVGLLVTLEMFLQYGNPATFISGIVVWLLGGITFGLLMRWQATRGKRHRSA